MLPIAAVHELATQYPPHVVTAWLLVGASLATLVVGFARRGRAFAPFAPGAAYVALAATFFFRSALRRSLPVPDVALFAVAALLLVIQVFILRDRTADEAPPVSNRAVWVYAGCALLIVTILVFERL